MNKMEKEQEGIKSGDNGTRGSEKITRENRTAAPRRAAKKRPAGAGSKRNPHRYE